MAAPALRAVAAQDLTVIVVGDTAYAARSVDGGTTWAEVTIGGTSNFSGIAASPSFEHWLAVTSATTDTVYISSNNGVTWSPATLPSAAAAQACFCFRSTAYTPGFVILRGTGIAWKVGGSTSISDLGAWFDTTGPGAATLRGATLHDGYLYVCGDAGMIARTASAAGTASPSWEVLTSGTADDLFAMHASGDILVAVGESGRIVYSTDGVAWSTATNGDPDELRGVQYDEVNRWTVVGATLESLESYRGLFNHGTLVITTKWIKVGQPSHVGQARVWKATLLAKRLGPHGLQIDVGHDYDETWAHSYSWTDEEIAAIADDGESYRVAVMPGRQKCSAIRFRITELTPAEFTYGLQPVSLTLDTGVRAGGSGKIPQSRER